MEELIRINTNPAGDQVVSARELHAFIGSKSQFTDWINAQIDRAMLVEAFDWVAVTEKKVTAQGNTVEYIEYALSLSAAKEIAMLNGGEKGKQARLYFIACEKKAKELTKPLIGIDFLQQQLDLMRQQNVKLDLFEERLDKVEKLALAGNHSNSGFYSILGYATVVCRKIDLAEAANLGKRAKQLSDTMGFHVGRVPDPRFGKVNIYHEDVLKSVFGI